MSIRSLIPASAICGAMLVPAFASLSNLDRKYNTGGARQTTTTTNRKPAVSRTAGRTPKPQREAGQAATTVKPDRGQAQEKPRKGNSEPETINPAEDEDLAANLKLVTDMLTAWKNGDDQTLLDIFTPTVQSLETVWNGGEKTNIPAEEAVAILYDAPRSFIENITCDEGYYVDIHVLDHVYFMLLLFQNEQGEYAMHSIILNNEKKITNFSYSPFSLTADTWRAHAKEICESIAKLLSIQPIHISTATLQEQAAPGTAPRQSNVAGVGTWGTVDADFSDSPLVIQAEKMVVPAKSYNAVLSQYCNLRTEPAAYRQAADERRKLLADLASRPDLTGKLPPMLHFKNAIQLLGDEREVSRDEFLSMIESRLLRWPLNAKLEAVSATGAHLSTTYAIGTFGYVEPIHLRTDFLLDAEGNVTAIGETQLSAAPAAWADHAACTWGQRDADLTRDPALTPFTEPVAQMDGAGFSKQAAAIAASYLAYRGHRALARRQAGDFSARGPFRDDSADAITVFGSSAKMSFTELQCALLDPALCFPEGTTAIACGTKDGNKVEVIYKLEPPGQKEPLYLKTLFAFNPQGHITAVGETLCHSAAATLDEGFAPAAPPSSL